MDPIDWIRSIDTWRIVAANGQELARVESTSFQHEIYILGTRYGGYVSLSGAQKIALGVLRSIAADITETVGLK